MTDLFKLILGILVSRFKARATLEAENLVLRQQVNVLRRRTPKLRVPTKPAMHSNLKPAGYSDRKPATLGVNRMGRFDDVVEG
jgi:hypothetical protein